MVLDLDERLSRLMKRKDGDLIDDEDYMEKAEAFRVYNAGLEARQAHPRVHAPAECVPCRFVPFRALIVLRRCAHAVPKYGNFPRL